MKLEDLITEAFAARPRPDPVVVVGHPETNEYLEALQFRNYDCTVTTCDLWSKFSDAIYGFCPQAFCYYLPGMLRSQLVEDRPDLLINSSVIAMLDRSDSVEYWDSFFIERWPLLTRQECLAVQEWVLWLSFKQTGIFSESSLTRAYETLEILASPAR